MLEKWIWRDIGYPKRTPIHSLYRRMNPDIHTLTYAALPPRQTPQFADFSYSIYLLHNWLINISGMWAIESARRLCLSRSMSPNGQWMMTSIRAIATLTPVHHVTVEYNNETPRYPMQARRTPKETYLVTIVTQKLTIL